MRRVAFRAYVVLVVHPSLWWVDRVLRGHRWLVVRLAQPPEY